MYEALNFLLFVQRFPLILFLEILKRIVVFCFKWILQYSNYNLNVLVIFHTTWLSFTVNKLTQNQNKLSNYQAINNNNQITDSLPKRLLIESSNLNEKDYLSWIFIKREENWNKNKYKIANNTFRLNNNYSNQVE